MLVQKKITLTSLLFLLTVSAAILPILLSSPLLSNNMSDQGTINRDSNPRVAIAPIEDGTWWNSSWHYRIGVYVNASSLMRNESLFEIWINFTNLLVNELGVSGETVDINSIRVIEQNNQTGTLIVHNATDNRYPDAIYEVPCSFWDDLKFNAQTNARLNVAWVLNGITPANSIRTYCVYFDILTNGPKQDVEYWRYLRGTTTGAPAETLNNDGVSTNTLYWLKSANSTAFMSGTTTANAYWQGQLVRSWFKTDSTSTRVNRYYIDYVAWEIANRANVGGTITNRIWSDNKLTFETWYTRAEEVRMNLTYEVFENSLFTRVVATVESLGYTGNVPMRYSGDADYQTSAQHVDDTGDTTEPTYPVTKWLCMWNDVGNHYGVLGYMLNPENSETVRLTDTTEGFELVGEVKNLAAIGDKGQFSFYVVAGPKGPPGNRSKWMAELYNDLYTPKLSTFGEAQFIAPTIVINVRDSDNFPVAGASVFLNRSQNGAQILDTKTTNAQGVCTFHTLTNGYYNFTVNISSQTTETTLQTNWTGVNQLFNTHRRYITINSSAWKMQFNVEDADGHPLAGNAWISINKSATTYLQNVTLDASGTGIFRWINASNYNYTVYYQDPLYNSGTPITVYGGIVQFASHVQFTLETVNIVVPLSRVNFTVSGWTTILTPLYGAILEIYNSSLESGEPNTGDKLGETPAADVNGNTYFYWRTKEAGPLENYSLYVKVGGSNNNLLNTTNGPPFSVFGLNYQNFTVTSSFNKSVVVNFDSQNFEARLVRVNPSVNNHYWNTHTVIQAIYEHKAGVGASWMTAAPSWIRYSITHSGVPLVSGIDMVLTTQPGRYEAELNMTALGMVAGESYTVEIEAVEGGFQVPTPITYLINVIALPTSMIAQQTSFQSVWGDVNTTTIQYSTVYPNTLIYDYQVRNYTSSDFIISIPKIENEWLLTRIEFNFSNIIASGGYQINVYNDSLKLEGIGVIIDSGNAPYKILAIDTYGPWTDADLDFTIDGSGGFVSCDVTARGYFTRKAVVVNQSVDYLDKASVLFLDSPGVGWKLNRLILDIETIDSIPADLRFSLENRTTPLDIDATHQEYAGLAYYINPLVNYIAINFSAGGPFAFNATFSCEFERVIDKHDLGDTDLGISNFGPLGTSDKLVDLTLPNKLWNITHYDLAFTDFTNTTYELVKHEDYTIQIFYDGSWRSITPLGDGTFSLAINAPLDTSTLSFQVDYPSISAFNLTISRINSLENYWGIEGASLSYYLFSNSSVTGTIPPVGIYDGDYRLSFDTSRALIGTQILKLTASRTNFVTATMDISFNIAQIPTEVNGSTIFNRNRRLYKTETQLYYIEYNDTYNLQDGHSIGISGATATFFVGYYSLEDPDADTPISTDNGDLIEVLPGLYLLDYNTAIRAEGIYKFSLSFSTVNNAYQPRSPTLTVRIDLIPSQATPYTIVIQERIQRDNATFDFRLADGRVDHPNEYYPEGLTDVAVAFTSANTFSSSYLSWKNGTGDGFFNLTVDTRSILPATYTLQVTFTRANYTANTTSITLTVIRFQPVVTIPSGVVSVTEGQVANIQLSITDALPELGQTIEAIVISWNVEGTSLSNQIIVVNAEGDYVISFPTTILSAATNYNVLVTVNVTVGGVVYSYASTLTINVRVEYENIFGIPRPYFWIMMIAVVVLVSTLVLYRYVKYARIPQFVRDIQRVRTTIRKGKSVGRESITESRSETISKALELRYAAIGIILAEKFTPKSSEETKKGSGERKPEEEVA